MPQQISQLWYDGRTLLAFFVYTPTRKLRVWAESEADAIEKASMAGHGVIRIEPRMEDEE